MKFIRGIHNIHEQHHGCVLTVGNFDGVHRGHQALMRGLLAEGRQRNLPVIIMVFEPQPLELFIGEGAPSRLTRLREKLMCLSDIGVDYVLCIRFDRRFASLSARNYVRELLVGKLGVKYMVVGDDFRFGANRQGDFRLLKKAGMECGFDVVSTETFCEVGTRISSTAIRQALAQDDLEMAQSLLGHPFSISGRVVHGDALGRTLGFPTANLPLHRSPVKGVYAVEVHGLTAHSLPGVANIGTRPTVKGLCQQLEVHLLDINISFYGHHITVLLKQKIRNEQCFASKSALKEQIEKDMLVARQYFGRYTEETG